ncbi:MAG: hypothetical protein BRD33_01730 [Bacteroidetes bacterium QH_6_63_17]|nr:MAG: hypothetical protein BRD33_01730 [Bacteroidetes bacterium QH_6_63_17]
MGRPSAKPKLANKGAEVLLEKPVNEILQAEMTKHLGADSGEQTSGRREHRNSSYERQLTTRASSLNMEFPRDRDGGYQPNLFQRQERSEKSLVTTLMQMIIEGVRVHRVKDITTERLPPRELSLR